MKSNIPNELRHSAGIYQIKNTVNGRVYIGSTKQFDMRLRTHKSALHKHKKSNVRLLNAYIKYGGESFEFNVLQVVERVEGETAEQFALRLLSKEQEYIDLYRSSDRSVGYNIRHQADSNKGAILLRKKFVGEHIIKPSINLAMGSKNHLAKINEEAALEIKILSVKGIRPANIARFLMLPPGIVGDIVSGKTWKHCEPTQAQIDNYPLPAREALKGHRLNVEDVKKVKYLLKAGYKQAAIAEFLKIHKCTVKNINGGGYNQIDVSASEIKRFESSGFLKIFATFESSRNLILRKKALLTAKGSANNFSILTESEVLKIKQLLEAGGSLSVIGQAFNVSTSCIYRIKHGYNWSHVTGVRRS